MPPTIACAVPVAPPVSPPVTVGTDDQVYVVPVGITSDPTPSISAKVKASLLQAVAVFAAIIALGLMVAITVKSCPIQLVPPGTVGLTV